MTIDNFDGTAARSNDDLLSALEAILMVAEDPVPAELLADSLRVPTERVVDALESLRAEYDGFPAEDALDGRPVRVRGFELRNYGGGWRFYSRAQWAPEVGLFVVGKETAHLSQAALETLAIVAYRQPVTRLEVSQIRGVNVDSVMRNLQTRGLIVEVGSTPTGAYLYETTPYFLECMGFETIGELIPLAPFLPSAQEVATATLEVEVD